MGLFIIYWEYGTGVLWERPMENVLVPSTKIFKKVSVPSVEGRKKSMSRIITLYSHCTSGSRAWPWWGPGGEAKILCLLFQKRNYASLIYPVKMASSLWQVAKIN